MQSSSLVRVAVVGAGSIGREYALNHLTAAAGCVVSAIVDLDSTKAAAPAADVGSVVAGSSISGGIFGGDHAKAERSTVAKPKAQPEQLAIAGMATAKNQEAAAALRARLARQNQTRHSAGDATAWARQPRWSQDGGGGTGQHAGTSPANGPGHHRKNSSMDAAAAEHLGAGLSCAVTQGDFH